MDEVKEKDLLKLYRARLRDKAQSRTRRRRQVESAPQPLGNLVEAFFQSDGDAMRRIEESKAIQAWEALVGPTGARFSKAIKTRGDTLIVKVADPLWMQQLMLLKRQLLKKYRALMPKLGLKDIYFIRGS